MLTAENNFISDWINSNYLFKLMSIAKELEQVIDWNLTDKEEYLSLIKRSVKI